jgi:hypothetical protein
MLIALAEGAFDLILDHSSHLVAPWWKTDRLQSILLFTQAVVSVWPSRHKHGGRFQGLRIRLSAKAQGKKKVREV